MNLVVLSHVEPILCGIYLIVSYNFIINRPLCCIINQQQLQWATSESS